MVTFYDRLTGVTSNLSWTWLKKGGFKKETEGLLGPGIANQCKKGKD